MSSGKIAFALCAGVFGGGLIGLQVQSLMINRQREKEAAFIESEVQKKLLERKRQTGHEAV